MVVILPQLAYIGHAFVNYTILNPTNPSVTPRGLSYYDEFTAGRLEFIGSSAPTAQTRFNTSQIEEFEADRDSAPYIVDILHGGDYFTQRLAPAPGYLELDSTGVGKSATSGNLVRFTAGGFIKISTKVAQIFARSPTAASMEFGETDFWEPIVFDTPDKDLLWLNMRVCISQGRLLVKDSRAYGFELRLWTLVNGDNGASVVDNPNTAPKLVDDLVG